MEISTQKGEQGRPEGQPIKVRGHDFEDKQLGHAIPYGVYDLTYNQGWVSVGIDHDTAEFAVETIRHWWYVGRELYPAASELLATADAGGRNGYRLRLWKVGLQALADEIDLRAYRAAAFLRGAANGTRLSIGCCGHITQNWRGAPLVSRTVIVNLIGNTTTDTGLRIKAKLDLNTYPKGIEVTDEAVEAINIEKHKFHGEWNYAISPKS